MSASFLVGWHSSSFSSSFATTILDSLLAIGNDGDEQRWYTFPRTRRPCKINRQDLFASLSSSLVSPDVLFGSDFLSLSRVLRARHYCSDPVGGLATCEGNEVADKPASLSVIRRLSSAGEASSNYDEAPSPRRGKGKPRKAQVPGGLCITQAESKKLSVPRDRIQDKNERWNELEHVMGSTIVYSWIVQNA